MATGKLHNEDLSIYFFLKDLVIDTTTLGAFARIVDGYPYNELESDTLTLPTVSIESAYTMESGVGELGASWFRRGWVVDVFAKTDVQRDDIADRIFIALGNSIAIKDYSSGYRKDTGLSIAGTPLRIIEYMNADDRIIRPIYSFNLYSKLKYWRATITFDTVSTQAV